MAADSRDQDRFTALYRRHHTRVLAYALRRVDAEAAQDVLAETFIAAWRELPKLPADPLPWLYKAAGYRIANERRSATRRARLVVRASGMVQPTEPDHAQHVVESARVHAALRQLSAVDREALLLVCWEDLDHAAAAYVMGCSTATFKVRLLRARRRLARRLTNPNDLSVEHPDRVKEVAR